MTGRTLAHYTITAQIGAGGMGVVWKAWDTKLQRDVAIKTLPPQPDHEARRRFFREAQMASALNHPNIVTVYQIDSEGDTDFIAMEYVQGRTLQAILKNERPPFAQALHWAIQAVDGVARAHAAGIVHRDLKPGNIMVTDDGRVKVLDFGLAKAAPEAPGESDAATETRLTAYGHIVGTPSYMSPEQLVADSVDLRSDVFALGIILYELFTGINPFSGDTRVDSVTRLLSADPAPPRTVAKDLPEPLDRIILRCLERRRENRYEHAGALLADLRTVAPALPAASQPRRSLTLAAGALLLAATIGGVLWLKPGSTATGDAAPAPPATAQQLTMGAMEQLRHYYRPNAVDEAITKLESALAKEPDSAVAYAALSEAHLVKYLNTVDQQWLRSAEQHARKAVDLAPSLAAAHLSLARSQLEAGKRDEALATLASAADLDPRDALVETTTARALAAQGRSAEAEPRFVRAIDLDPKDWRPPTEFALFLYRATRYDEAATRLEQARALAPENQIILRNLSAALIQLDRFDEAASVIQRALTIRPTAALHANLGYIRFYQGRYEDAIGPFEEALKGTPNNYRNWGNLGDAYRWTPARKAEAAGAYARGIDLAREAAKASPDDLDVRSSLAVYLAKSGRVEECREELRGIAASKRPPSAAVRFKTALAFELSGDRDSALTWMQQAIEAGYPVRELRFEPDLAEMRRDVRYHRLLTRKAPSRPSS
jgi:tetratricopeptide (TPR) repeat protein/predicted Ser/Thr protein kinase